jgi:hypothetical protein
MIWISNTGATGSMPTSVFLMTTMSLKKAVERARGYDGLTDRVGLRDSVKFAAYDGSLLSSGTYIGFAPIDDE